MKNLYLRTGLALACALTVVACGGKGGNLFVGGTVVSLPKPGLVLLNKGGSAQTINQAGPFYFNEIDSDEAYEVTVGTQPPNSECKVRSGKGTTGAYSVQNVVVTCTLFTQTVGGTVTTYQPETEGNNLVIINGSNQVTIKQAGAFNLNYTDAAGNVLGKVGQTEPYVVLIYKQPASQTCTVTNGTGIVGTADVSNIVINCVPK